MFRSIRMHGQLSLMLLASTFGLAPTSLTAADNPTASITAPAAANTVAEANQIITFAASSTPPGDYDLYTATFSWDFGDGTTGAGASTVHAYAAGSFTTAQTYTVTLTVSWVGKTCYKADLNGNCTGYKVTGSGSASSTRTITVTPPPKINSFTADTSSVETGKAVTLGWSTSNATSVKLTTLVSGVTSTVDVTGQSSKVVSVNAPTTFTLVASTAVNQATSSLGVGTYNISVGISPASGTLLLGGSQPLTGTVSGGTQGVGWTADNGLLSEVTNTQAASATYTATTSGVYSVTAYSLQDPSISATCSIAVATVAVATPVPVPATSLTYVGGSVTFSAIVSGAVNENVSWSVNGGGTIDTATGKFTATTQGTWVVTATSVADPTKSATNTVYVDPVVVNIMPDTPLMQPGQTKTFTASITAPGQAPSNQSVTWSVVESAGGTITTSSGVYTAPSIPGDYTVKAVSSQDPSCFGTTKVHVGGWTLKWKKDVVYMDNQEIAEMDASGKTWTAFNDHSGTARLIWDGVSNPVKGVDLIEQKFMPFGESLTDPNSAAKFEKGFTNHEQTDPSGLIYMQARFYAPWYGRFLSPDPARDQHFEQTQSWNIYSYVQNDPTMNLDPNGEDLVAIRLRNSESVSVNSCTRGNVIVVDRSMVPSITALILRAEKDHTRMIITSSFRTNEEQAKLNNKNAVTPAKSGSSPHNAGLAIDGTNGKSSLPDSVVDQAEDLGLRWGGDFRKPDNVHVDGVENNKQKFSLIKENQQQWKSGTVQGMELDATSGRLSPANIPNSEMKRISGSTGVSQSTPAPLASEPSPTIWDRVTTWLGRVATSI